MAFYRLCCLVYLQLLSQLCPGTLGCVYLAFSTEICTSTHYAHIYLKAHSRANKQTQRHIPLPLEQQEW